jgi:alcohol dehydrogenase class IV
MQASFSFTAMPRLLFGPGQIRALGSHVAGFGRSVLLVTGANSLQRSGQLDTVTTDLTSRSLRVRHCQIAGEPSPDVVDTVVAAFSHEPPDVVVAIGGGSVIDTGKAIAAMLEEDGSVADFLEGVGSRQPSGRSLPVIAVPTTSGTGSEATKNAVISQIGEDGFKKSLRHDNFIPKLAIIDPDLCVSAPPSVTAACGMDALTQLIESYVSTKASPLTDALALEGMRHLIPALPRACGPGARDVGCRGAVAYGALLSGVTLAHAGLGVVHGTAGPMGGRVAVPHGVACANLLPFAVKATIDNLTADGTPAARVAIEKVAWIGKQFGATHNMPLDCCRYLIAQLYNWLDRLAIPRIGRFGVTADQIDRLVELADNKNNPLPLTAGQIRQMILDRC